MYAYIIKWYSFLTCIISFVGPYIGRNRIKDYSIYLCLNMTLINVIFSLQNFEKIWLKAFIKFFLEHMCPLHGDENEIKA